VLHLLLVFLSSLLLSSLSLLLLVDHVLVGLGHLVDLGHHEVFPLSKQFLEQMNLFRFSLLLVLILHFLRLLRLVLLLSILDQFLLLLGDHLLVRLDHILDLVVVHNGHLHCGVSGHPHNAINLL